MAMPETHALAAEEIMPDTGPGMEWYRERADEDVGKAARDE
jgi:hypothetical protein